jgi:hypothetical protein
MRNIILLFISLSLVSCISETFKGQSKLDRDSFEWIPFQGGEKLVFKNMNVNAENSSMSYQLGERKSIFNQISDCYEKNTFHDQCDIYSMEYNFVTATSMDKKNTMTYSLERGTVNGKFYDEWKMALHVYGHADIILRFQVFNQAGEIINNLRFENAVILGEKKFENVYIQENDTQIIYLTKDDGVIAFMIDGENLWVREK